MGNRYRSPGFIIRICGRYCGVAGIQNNWEFSLRRGQENHTEKIQQCSVWMVVRGGSGMVMEKRGSSKVDFFCIRLYMDFSFLKLKVGRS